MGYNRPFHNKHSRCLYSSLFFNRVVSHVWDNHSVKASFSYICSVSSCTKQFSNQQSFHRHIRSMRNSIYEADMTSKSRNSENSAISETFYKQVHNEEELIINELEINRNSSRANANSEEACDGSLENLNVDSVIAEILLEFREVYKVSNVTTFW